MSSKIIKELYLENQGLCELIQDTEKYKKVLDEFYEFKQSFEANLTSEQKENLEKLIDLTRELEWESTLNHFIFGFKTGLQLGAEAFT